MPPLPADFIHARACKLKCEKILTRPLLAGGAFAPYKRFRRKRKPWRRADSLRPSM